MTSFPANQAAIDFADQIHRRRARGWNTWDTRSVFRHVLLPEGLAISLGFAALDKLVWIDEGFFGKQELARPTGMMLTSLDKAPPIGNFLEVRPGPHSYDGSYTELEVNLRGARYRIQSCSEGNDWLALIEPLQNEPWPRAVTVQVNYLWGQPGYATCEGPDCIGVHGPGRNFNIYTAGSPFEDRNLPVLMPALAVRLDGPVVVSADGRASVADAREKLRAAEQILRDRFIKSGKLTEAHEAIHSCLGWNIIYEPRYSRVLCTVARDWNCKRGGYVVFCWDTFLTAWIMAYDDPELAYAWAMEAFREMVDDEFVSNQAQGSGRRALDRSQPPVGSLAFLGMHRMAPNAAALAAAWPALLAWNRWRHNHRRNKAGSISLGSNPFTPRVGDPAEFVQPDTAAGAALESGLDNLPIYDGAPFDSQSHLLLTEDIGTNSLYIADCEALAEIAAVLGHEVEAEELRSRAAAYRSRLRTLFDETIGIYRERWLTGNGWHERLAVTAFYPLLAGAPNLDQAARLIADHLLNPAEFGGAHMIPAVPRNDPVFPEQVYLRGRIWPPINFLIYLGLKRYGATAAAAIVAEKSLALLLENWREERVVAENYAGTDGRGGRGLHTHPLYAWGGLLGLMSILEEHPEWLPLPPLEA